MHREALVGKHTGAVLDGEGATERQRASVRRRGAQRRQKRSRKKRASTTSWRFKRDRETEVQQRSQGTERLGQGDQFR